MSDYIDRCFALRNESLAEIASRFGMEDAHTSRKLAYEGMTGLLLLHNPAEHPARFYFRGDTLVMIYTSDSATLAALDERQLVERFGSDSVALRSRAGKEFVHTVFAEQGVAFSSSSAEGVVFLEIFPPTTQAAYEEEIYQDPGHFYK